MINKNIVPPIENNNQRSFYEQETVVLSLQKCAENRGLDTGCDIEIILPELANSTHLLEVGAGYGRALEHLQRLHYTGHITAIEKSLRLFNELAAKHTDSADLIHGDILDYNPTKLFDTILYLWSGICDFMPEQQVQVLKKFKSLLAPGGLIALETIYTEHKPSNFHLLSPQLYQINERGCIGNYYIPTSDEIIEAAQEAGLNLKKYMVYETPANLQRCIYLLTH